MISLGMSTSCVYPLGVEAGFRIGHLAGYDGIEVMVTGDPVTQKAETLMALSNKYEMPILAIHAPVLFLTHFVWGTDPAVKLHRAGELAAEVGAGSVVVHPPFRAQGNYALRFEEHVRATAAATGVEICVENMFPWKLGSLNLRAYSPSPDPLDLDVDAMTLDFSHASLSGRDSLEMAMAMGSRLRHIHLTDGVKSADEGNMFDEHLIPGHGTQPVAETLQYLVSSGWSGSVVAEVVTRKAKTEVERLAALTETVAFAREHLGQAHASREPRAGITREPARRAERREERRAAKA